MIFRKDLQGRDKVFPNSVASNQLQEFQLVSGFLHDSWPYRRSGVHHYCVDSTLQPGMHRNALGIESSNGRVQPYKAQAGA